MTIRHAVFPAAGLGTRFLPATKSQPKEMLPLVDKPIIQYGVEEALASGLKQIVMITGRGKRALEDHFDINYELEENLRAKGKTEVLEEVESISRLANFIYIRQKEAKGLGDAVAQAEEVVNGEPFLVILPDDVIVGSPPVTEQMIGQFEKVKSTILAVMEVPKEEVSRWGIVKPKKGQKGDLLELEDLVEKPDPTSSPSNLAVIGRYILTPQIFAELKKVKPGAGGEIQLTDGIKGLLKKEKVFAYKFQGEYFDCGEKLGYLKTQVKLALKRDDLKEEFKKFLKKLRM